MVRPAPGAILIEDSRTSVCLVGRNAGRPPLRRHYPGSNARVMLGPPWAPDRPLNLHGFARISVRVLLLLVLLSRSGFQKLFIVNSLHGEGIEPPTYWV